MEDNIIIINSSSDLEKNLIFQDIETAPAKNNKKLAFAVLGLVLFSSVIAGFFFIGIKFETSQPIQQKVYSQSNLNANEITTSQYKKQNETTQNSIKQGPQNNLFVPDTFDIRQQSSSISCDFTLPDEMLCVGGNWSYAIVSTISNTICTQKIGQKEIPLSSQYLLNCSGLQNKCDILQSREGFEAQLDIVSTQGIPTAACAPYNGLNYMIQPNNCNQKCNDNTEITLNKYKLVQLWDSNDDMNATIMNVKSHLYNYGPVIALIKHSSSVARYSGATANGIFVNDPSDITNFGYRAYKIVGWNLAPGDTPTPYWLMGNTFSSNWGMSGYLRTNLNEPIIEGYYGYIPSN